MCGKISVIKINLIIALVSWNAVQFSRRIKFPKSAINFSLFGLNIGFNVVNE